MFNCALTYYFHLRVSNLLAWFYVIIANIHLPINICRNMGTNNALNYFVHVLTTLVEIKIFHDCLFKLIII